MMTESRPKVLIVDDSALARDLLERGLSADPRIEVVGKATDAYSARDKIVFLRPDVVTLDIEMPKLDGISFLKKLMAQYPIPVVIVSSTAEKGSMRAFEAMRAGAIDVVSKPNARDFGGVEAMIAELADRVFAAAQANVAKIPTKQTIAKVERIRREADSENRIIAIGASTGGTAALNAIIPRLPKDAPGGVVVQHMPPVFTRLFAESLDKISEVTVLEAKDGDPIAQGTLYIAPGGLQCTVEGNPGSWKIRCRNGEKVSGHCPSVDVLFESVAQHAGDRAVGCLLTGMGRDGANGLLAMRKRGARCLAQDEDSSVVFGMPKEAWENGAAERLVPIEGIAGAILSCLERKPSTGVTYGRS